ncbi:pre-mRNA splicing factor slt-11 [Penicillium argentinense]|uniref:Pre-mRNA-splicing factor SLT11 n=1 Tax=Penicillium argentinense TaxID=1131581 RepID=A0A9W9G1S1_9EURO|nr:pre-mRNA splicing factor slt-11 [Penicillium argentinense]KAJ5110421.1 pre-mRNA splicing factor slt-11 [Penicillium argentinense]
MPPQIKKDLNRSGWESTDFPSVCENCLPDNPYVQMLKEDYGAECKICTRPFTIFRWKADRTSRQKRTIICLTCARLKNCCQHCMLDLSFGLPTVVRDAALKMIAPGPESSINREYYAQNNEKEIEEGRGAIEEYEKTDEKARELLRRLANSQPYHRKQRIEGTSGDADDNAGEGSSAAEPVGHSRYGNGPGPIRTSDSRARAGRGGRGGARGGRPFPGTAQLPPSAQDIKPPADQNITSLFVTGVEDDLPEHALRTFFTEFGQLRSLVCSHRSHCAFINYVNRADAEAAAEKCQGKAIIRGCPLRVRWGKPKSLDNMDREERVRNAREGRQAVGPASKRAAGKKAVTAPGAPTQEAEAPSYAVAPPPGSGDVQYASMRGD